ncbi:MAG: low molecular weight phosphatase family protein [Alphaproteobacteria bacterium]|nr:low molecular weight phosphatase family protein [Alphaproteobacteria bacterium]
MAVQPSAILFTCSLNSVRSPMAEAIMKHLHGHRIYVASVGVRPGEPDPFVDVVMDEIGIDMSRHRIKTFDQLDDDYFDLIVTLSPEAHHKALEMTRTMSCDVEFWPTLDATAVDGSRDMRLDAYRAVRDTLLRRITERFARPPVADV